MGRTVTLLLGAYYTCSGLRPLPSSESAIVGPATLRVNGEMSPRRPVAGFRRAACVTATASRDSLRAKENTDRDWYVWTLLPTPRNQVYLTKPNCQMRMHFCRYHTKLVS